MHPQDLEYAKKQKDNFYVKDGIARWKSNDRVPFDDMLECFQHLGRITEDVRKNSAPAREAEAAAAIAEYRKNYKGPSAEDLMEMRAAFGPGEKVINVLTGTEIQL